MVNSRKMAALVPALLLFLQALQPSLNLALQTEGPWNTRWERRWLLKEHKPGREHNKIGCLKTFLSLWDFVARINVYNLKFSPAPLRLGKGIF